MENLVLDIIVIVTELHSQTVVQELVLDTQLILMLLFWFDAFVTDLGFNKCVCIGIVLVQRTLLVGHVCPVNLRSVTYDTV